ncbi:MAG: hypothetical protein R6T92_02135 [Desulfosalsimonadaceae bacterium]
MITRFLPWKFLLKSAARRFGIIDPLNLIARVRRFSQPSEVQEPIELLRAGIIFHARGLINSRVIQYNLDWIWPFWAERQFDPNAASFIPRGFSFSHVNLTHRNWTAVGYPDVAAYPIVDPQGLFTPLYDGWSIDCWIIAKDGTWFIPSRLETAAQEIQQSPLAVDTHLEKDGFVLDTTIRMTHENGRFYACMEAEASSEKEAWLVIAIRPYNPEGIQFIENLRFEKDPACFWVVNRHTRVYLDQEPEKVLFSNYLDGDVVHQYSGPETEQKIHCGVGLATSAAFFPISGKSRHIKISADISRDLPPGRTVRIPPPDFWEKNLEGAARLTVPDDRIQRLYDTALSTILLLSAGDAVPGPYTYFRFWFRDACLMINAMMGVNLLDRAYRHLDSFPERRKISGYFQSQQGEWDSNGQVLWILGRYLDLTGTRPSAKWLDAIFKGGMWIQKKRTRKKSGRPHEGLLPAGFSAEHLGPNDFYYWDNFWGLAGLQTAAKIARKYHSSGLGDRFDQYAANFEQTIFSSIENIPGAKSQGCIPASPYRRMDAGAIGSLVADYPLQLLPAGDSLIANTADYLIDSCFHRGAFFQDMIHSGINVYLTLDIAQTLMRHGDVRYRDLIEKVVDLASPTGQWPEAIHPLTGGGCMGDGQHGWAAAEFLMIIRNMFVREEAGRLVIGSGLFPEWIDDKAPVVYGPTATPFGPVSVSVEKTDRGANVTLDNQWRGYPPEIDIRIPGFVRRLYTEHREGSLTLEVEKI